MQTFWNSTSSIFSYYILFQPVNAVVTCFFSSFRLWSRRFSTVLTTSIEGVSSAARASCTRGVEREGGQVIDALQVSLLRGESSTLQIRRWDIVPRALGFVTYSQSSIYPTIFESPTFFLSFVCTYVRTCASTLTSRRGKTKISRDRLACNFVSSLLKWLFSARDKRGVRWSWRLLGHVRLGVKISRVRFWEVALIAGWAPTTLPLNALKYHSLATLLSVTRCLHSTWSLTCSLSDAWNFFPASVQKITCRKLRKILLESFITFYAKTNICSNETNETDSFSQL